MNSKVHYRLLKIPPLFLILSQTNPFYVLRSSFSQNQSNIILLFILTFSTKSVHTFLSHIHLRLYEISNIIGFDIRFSLINFVIQIVRVRLSSQKVLCFTCLESEPAFFCIDKLTSLAEFRHSDPSITYLPTSLVVVVIIPDKSISKLTVRSVNWVHFDGVTSGNLRVVPYF